MADGFLMLPRAGLVMCREPGDYAALAWLCTEAHTMDPTGWTKPVEATNAALCLASGKGRGWCRSFLNRMESCGAMEIVDPGDRHSARTVRMVWPVPEKVIHDVDHNADHQSDGSTGGTGRSDSRDDSPRAQPEVESKRGKVEREKKPKRKRAPVDPRVKQTTDLWAALHRQRTGGAYAWDWHRDRENLTACLGAAEAVAEGEELAALERAIGLYLDDVAAGRAWPQGSPPTTKAFRANVQTYLAPQQSGPVGAAYKVWEG